MSTIFDTMAEISTTTVLAGAGVAKMKYFSFEGHTFSPLFLAGLAEDIKNKYLHVSKDSTKDGSSGYDAFTNTIYLNFAGATSVTQKAMIVHEATHAMFDFQGRKMDIATSESLSYIAQCMYARVNSTDPDPEARLYSEDAARDKVFEVGWRIAGKIIANGSSNSVYSIESSDVNDMRAAVSVHPFYASTYTQKTDFNGYR